MEAVADVAEDVVDLGKELLFDVGFEDRLGDFTIEVEAAYVEAGLTLRSSGGSLFAFGGFFVARSGFLPFLLPSFQPECFELCDLVRVIVCAVARDEGIRMKETLEEGVRGFVGAFECGAEVEFDVVFIRLSAFRRVEPPSRAVSEDAPIQLPLAQSGDEFRRPEPADVFMVEICAWLDDVEKSDAVLETVVLEQPVKSASEGLVFDDEARDSRAPF
jgi:hypothetical protein